MTQNGLKHILNMFLKSVMKIGLDPQMQTILNFFYNEGFLKVVNLNAISVFVEIMKF